MAKPLHSESSKRVSRVLQEKLAASRYFTFSLLLHVIILVMAGSVVLFTPFTEPPDFVAEGGGGLVSNDPVQAPPEAPQEVAAEQTFAAQAPQAAPAVPAITSMASVKTDFSMPASVPVQVKVAPGDLTRSLTETVKAVGRGAGIGPGHVMGARIGGTQRATAMQKYGGKDKSEKAVIAGLRWLKDHQNSDGSWSNERRGAMTGLAVLCFLGHGELPESPDFGPTVKKGIDWLLKEGSKYDGHLSMEKGWKDKPAVYEHGIATYALGEYYTMTKDDRIVPLLQQAVALIVNGQNPRGGWDYQFAKGSRNDLSVAGWQIQALKAAHLTGLNLPGVDEALDRAMVFLKQWQGNEGGFGYDAPDNKWSLTGVGVLCIYFWKQDKDKSVRDGVEYLLAGTDKDHPIKYKDDACDLYAWYYHTQACLMYGGTAWNKWNKMFQDEIVDAQTPDGSWPPQKAKITGSHTLQEANNIAGSVYRTTLCTLMLEVYYRYMPVTKG